MKLYVFELGRFMYPGMPQPLPVPGYLIQTTAGQNILVDTGFPEKFIRHPPAPEPAEMAMRPGEYIVDQLAVIGLTPDDIDILVVSHLDIDHAGNLLPFSKAEILVQQQQYAAAKAGHPRFTATQEQWDNPLIRFRLLAGDVKIAEGVELIASSGHVPGHQSVLLHLPHTGPVLLTVDAILNATMTDAAARMVDVSADNDAEARDSTRKLMALAQREEAKLVLFGHDSAQWAGVKKAPDFYS